MVKMDTSDTVSLPTASLQNLSVNLVCKDTDVLSSAWKSCFITPKGNVDKKWLFLLWFSTENAGFLKKERKRKKISLNLLLPFFTSNFSGKNKKDNIENWIIV